MAALFTARLGLERLGSTGLFLALSCLITTVSCQNVSTSFSPLNITESNQTADYTSLPKNNYSSVTARMPTTSFMPTETNTPLPTKTVDAAMKESASVYDRKIIPEHSPLFSSDMPQYESDSSFVLTPTSELYKLASVYKVETETVSKDFFAEPVSSVFLGEEMQSGTAPMKSLTIEPTPSIKPDLYEPATLSSSQHSPDDFIGWATKHIQSFAKTEFKTGAIFPSHYYIHDSISVISSSVHSTRYPMSTSSFPPSNIMPSLTANPTVAMSVSPPVGLVNPSVSHTTGDINTPALFLSPSPVFNFSDVPSTQRIEESLISFKQLFTTVASSHSLHINYSSSDILSVSRIITNMPLHSAGFVTDHLLTSETQSPSRAPYYTQAHSSAIPTPVLSTSIPDWLGDSNSDYTTHSSHSAPPLPLPSVGLNESVSYSLDVTTASLLYPFPVVSPSVSFVHTTIKPSLSVPFPSTEHSAAHNETYLPSPMIIYPATEVAFIKSSETIREYDELLTSWSDFPTESYYTDEYYYEDTSITGYIPDQTEYTPDFPLSSTKNLPSSVGWIETSGTEQDYTSTEDRGETVVPLSPTLRIMSSSVHTTLPISSMIIQTSSQAPYVTTAPDTPEYINQKYILTFNGDCQPLVSNVEKAREFQSKVKEVLVSYLVIDQDSVYMDRLACGSVESHVIFYNATQNYSSNLASLVSSGAFLVEMVFSETNTSSTFRAYKVEEADFADSGETVTQGEEQEHHLGDKDIVLIVLACVICTVLVIIGIVICARHMYSKKYAQSFNLMDTRHANLKMDDYTLTQFPLPRRSYGEDGIQVQSYSHYQTNGQALLPPHNYNGHNQSSDLDSTLERSVDLGDIRLDGNKHSSFGTTTRTFDFSPSGSHLSAKGDGECALPSTSMDSSSSTHDRSTENLVPGLGGSTLHGSVNPIYSGDDTEGTASVSSDPPPYTDTSHANM